MSTEQTPEHSLPNEVVPTTLPNQITVGGEATLGIPKHIPFKPNTWVKNLFDPFVITSFLWSANARLAFQYSINLFDIFKEDVRLPWFLWFISFCRTFNVQFSLQIEFCGHPSMRGKYRACVTYDAAITQRGFLPITVVNVSGGNHMSEIELPGMFTLPEKINPAMMENRTLDAPTPSRTFNYADFNFGHLTVVEVTRLSSPDILPQEVHCLVWLTPDPNSFSSSGQIRPRTLGPNPIFVNTE